VAEKVFSVEEALEKLIFEAENIVAVSEREILGAPATEEAAATAETPTLTEILPGFPEEIEGEIVFCDADNINTDGIYPGKYTCQDNVTREKMAEVCMQNYDPPFGASARAGDIPVAGINFRCGSSREQAATAILVRDIGLVVAGSFGSIFSRNSIKNALMGVEVPKLVRRLREAFLAGNKGAGKLLTRRTGWRLRWDVRRSRVVVTEAGGESWSIAVGGAAAERAGDIRSGWPGEVG